MRTTWRKVIRLSGTDGRDLAFWETAARLHGVNVQHSTQVVCRTFDSSPDPGAVPGVYRAVGTVRFDKTTRRWAAFVNGDCTAEEAAAVVASCVGHCTHIGTKPGQRLRGRLWKHFTSDGHHVAEASLCYRITNPDQLNMLTETLVAPADASSLSHLVERHYDDLLREAEQA